MSGVTPNAQGQSLPTVEEGEDSSTYLNDLHAPAFINCTDADLLSNGALPAEAESSEAQTSEVDDGTTGADASSGAQAAAPATTERSLDDAANPLADFFQGQGSADTKIGDALANAVATPELGEPEADKGDLAKDVVADFPPLQVQAEAAAAPADQSLALPDLLGGAIAAPAEEKAPEETSGPLSNDSSVVVSIPPDGTAEEIEAAERGLTVLPDVLGGAVNADPDAAAAAESAEKAAPAEGAESGEAKEEAAPKAKAGEEEEEEEEIPPSWKGSVGPPGVLSPVGNTATLSDEPSEDVPVAAREVNLEGAEAAVEAAAEAPAEAQAETPAETPVEEAPAETPAETLPDLLGGSVAAAPAAEEKAAPEPTPAAEEKAAPEPTPALALPDLLGGSIAAAPPAEEKAAPEPTPAPALPDLLGGSVAAAPAVEEKAAPEPTPALALPDLLSGSIAAAPAVEEKAAPEPTPAPTPAALPDVLSGSIAAPAEETPAETPVEEAPAETPAEAAPVEEAPVEAAPPEPEPVAVQPPTQETVAALPGAAETSEPDSDVVSLDTQEGVDVTALHPYRLSGEAALEDTSSVTEVTKPVKPVTSKAAPARTTRPAPAAPVTAVPIPAKLPDTLATAAKPAAPVTAVPIPAKLPDTLATAAGKPAAPAEAIPTPAGLPAKPPATKKPPTREVPLSNLHNLAQAEGYSEDPQSLSEELSEETLARGDSPVRPPAVPGSPGRPVRSLRRYPGPAPAYHSPIYRSGESQAQRKPKAHTGGLDGPETAAVPEVRSSFPQSTKRSAAQQAPPTKAEQEALREATAEFKTECEAFDKQTKELEKELLAQQKQGREELAAAQKKELDDFDKRWKSGAKRRLYNRASNQVTILRRQLALLLVQGRFRDAEDVSRQVEEATRQEEVENALALQRDFEEALKKLEERQAQEQDTFEASATVARLRFTQNRAIARRLYETRGKKLASDGTDRQWIDQLVHRTQKPYPPTTKHGEIKEREVAAVLTLPVVKHRRQSSAQSGSRRSPDLV